MLPEYSIMLRLPKKHPASLRLVSANLLKILGGLRYLGERWGRLKAFGHVQGVDNAAWIL